MEKREYHPPAQNAVEGRGGYGEEEIKNLRQNVASEAKKKEDIPEDARTPKERIASAVHQYTEETPAKGTHGVGRTH